MKSIDMVLPGKLVGIHYTLRDVDGALLETSAARGARRRGAGARRSHRPAWS